jgi:hypothetical protein
MAQICPLLVASRSAKCIAQELSSARHRLRQAIVLAAARPEPETATTAVQRSGG